jgi:putative two-component system response regulator
LPAGVPGSRSPLLKAAAEIALTHHEKFDGTGYPAGLKGERIPIFGRIVGLVDIFDAVVSERCYKSASSFKEGFQHIKSLSGAHLDPRLVEEFVKLEDRIYEIYTANQTIRDSVKDWEER